MVCCYIESSHTLIASIYRPPDSNPSGFSSLLSHLQETVDRISDSHRMPDMYILTSASDLVYLMDENHLSQIVTEPTRGDNTLDLALTNVPRYIAEVRVRPTILSDHSLVHALLGFDMLGKAPSSPSESRNPHSFRNADYHNADFDAMNEAFNSVNWEDLWVLCDQDSKQYLELMKLTILQITLPSQ